MKNSSLISKENVSSIINEVIRPVLIFFFMIRFYTHKKHKKNTRHQKYQTTVLNFLFFFMIRFYTHKKH